MTTNSTGSSSDHDSSSSVGNVQQRRQELEEARARLQAAVNIISTICAPVLHLRPELMSDLRFVLQALDLP